VHIESGHSQFQVPPGFDDVPPEKKMTNNANNNNNNNNNCNVNNTHDNTKMDDMEDLSMDDDTVLPSALENVVQKSGTEDTEGGNSVSSSGLSSAPVERMDAFDQLDDDL
jgi:hypothetical protein